MPNTGKILKFIIHVPKFVKLIWRLFKDSRVSIIPKSGVVLAVAYLISPFDLFPDTMFPIGYIEDLLILYYLVKLFVRYSPPEVVAEHVRRIDDEKKNRRM